MSHRSHFPFLLLAALAMAVASLSAATVEIYDVPPTEVLNTQFTVTVNGQPVSVIESGHRNYPTDQSGRRVYAHFSFEGTVEIEVTGLDGHNLLPAEFGIVPSVHTSERIVFTLDRPRYMILTRHSNTVEDALFLFADPIDPRAPNPDAPEVLNYADFTGSINAALMEVAKREELDVLYIPPGTWPSGGVIDIPSNVTLYLAGGAKITNGLLRFRNVENAHVRGRGVLDFNRDGRNDFGFGIAGVDSQNISVHGVIARSANNWNTAIRHSRGIDILYLKVLNTN
jgi:hypothetical protein